MLSTLLPGDKVLHKGICYTVSAITSWSDRVHGKVYALDLEAGGKTIRVSFTEGAILERCQAGVADAAQQREGTYPAQELEVYPVSTVVNRANAEGAGLVEAVGEPA